MPLPVHFADIILFQLRVHAHVFELDWYFLSVFFPFIPLPRELVSIWKIQSGIPSEYYLWKDVRREFSVCNYSDVTLRTLWLVCDGMMSLLVTRLGHDAWLIQPQQRLCADLCSLLLSFLSNRLHCTQPNDPTRVRTKKKIVFISFSIIREFLLRDCS